MFFNFILLAFLNQFDYGEISKMDMFTICFRRILGDLDYWNKVNEQISWLKMANFLAATVTLFVVFLNMMVGKDCLYFILILFLMKRLIKSICMCSFYFLAHQFKLLLNMSSIFYMLFLLFLSFFF